MRFVTLLFFVISISVNHAQWFWQNPKITGDGLSKIQFVGNTGWMVGSYGTILKTTDDGQKWHTINTGTNQVLNSVHFITENEGWCTGDKLIVRTTNGGLSWLLYQIDSVDYLSSIFFINNQTGWVVGNKYDGVSWYNYIFKTTNRGDNWITKWVRIGGNELNSLFFRDPMVGFTVGNNGTIFTTSDGGETWTVLQSGTSVHLNSLQLIDNNNGFIVGRNGTILKTTNRGMSWINQNSGTGTDLFSIHMIDALTGWIVGGDYHSRIILKTTNSGASWSTQYTGFAGQLTSVYFTDHQKGWAVGGPNEWAGIMGAVLKTTNGGENWSDLNELKGESFNSICFINSSTGWAVGGANIPGTNYILKSVNGGDDWTIQRSDSNLNYNAIYFIDSLKGWTAGTGIFKTTNGGVQWTEVPLGAGNMWRTIHFINDQYGWIGGNNGKILRTTDQGNIWTSVSAGSDYLPINLISFISPDTGWLVKGGFHDLHIMKTINGGVNWEESTVPPLADINSLFFISKDTGYVGGHPVRLGYFPKLLLTTDGGVTWAEKDFFNNIYVDYVSSILFTSRNTGYVSCGVDYMVSYGCLFKTTDAGETWNKVVEANYALNKIHFLDASTGWVYSNNGLLLKTTNGGATFLEEERPKETPTSHSLSQNYPNPFNPSTKIKYTIPMDNGELLMDNGQLTMDNVTLKVFDILGREVATLVNKEQPPGNYEVEFNADQYRLPSGIYFYQLRAGSDIVITRKMLIIK